MAKTGPILIIENDAGDRDIMKDIFRELGVKNKLFFSAFVPMCPIAIMIIDYWNLCLHPNSYFLD